MNSYIIYALMHENIRVSNGNRWLIWNDSVEQWEVYGREYAQKKTRRIVSTESQKVAVMALLYKGEYGEPKNDEDN